MRRLHHLSLLLLIAGVLLTSFGALLGIGPLWTLSGLLLAIAGGVKLLVIYLWRNVIQIEDAEGVVHRG